VVGQILQARLGTPVVLADDEDEGVRRPDLRGERFDSRRRGAFVILLVHPVEHRQADRAGVDQLERMPTRWLR